MRETLMNTRVNNNAERRDRERRRTGRGKIEGSSEVEGRSALQSFAKRLVKSHALGCLLVGISLLLLATAMAQEATEKTSARQQRAIAERAVAEIDNVLATADRLMDKTAWVKVRAKAANLIWLYDSRRARTMFTELWKWIEEQEEKGFEREAARALVLKNLSPRDAKLAMTFLDELSEKNQKTSPDYVAQALGRDETLKRQTVLASDLIEQDTGSAALLLQKSLSVSVSPAAMLALLKLRDKDPVLADYVASQTLESLKGKPSFVALLGANLMLEYVFPAKQNFSESFHLPPDHTLRAQFFFTAYEILRASLAEDVAALRKNPQYSKGMLTVRDTYQGKLAIVLATLAAEQSSEKLAELQEIAGKLVKNLPPEVVQSANVLQLRLSNSKPKPEDGVVLAVTIAINREEFDEAKSLIGKVEDENLKKALTQALVQVEFRSHMGRANLAEALVVARQVEDLNLQASMFAQVAKATFRKGEIEFSKLILLEGRAALAKAECNGVQLKATFALAAEACGISVTEALELLYRGAACVSYLAKQGDAGDANSPPQLRALLAEINSPARLTEEPELRRAFALAAGLDFDNTLLAAGAIEEKVVELTARLAVCEGALKRSAGVAEKKIPERKGGN